MADVNRYIVIKPNKKLGLKIGNIVDGYEQPDKTLMIFLSGGWYIDDRDNYIRRIYEKIEQ